MSLARSLARSLLVVGCVTVAAFAPGAQSPARARGGASRAAAARAQFPSLPNPFGGGEGDVAPAAAPARAAPPSNPAWRGTVLDESLPDPVFDDTYEYKGRSKVGFVTYAELLNARMAMMGFTILFLQELLFGKGVLQMYGLPYDSGAFLG
ncbi:hypothetical protein EMIHUDRAFT_452580 [Emiliania huxleyi CCMP1516]|uniref:High light inducible protein n=2 Tax=Emiliania huxleyi TaxID=2903 RepID=A0A0D3II65_EMIH1|nr:hypothetical protein EMIHUDRAFT_452580 [Emiliania huxleyi CCMP1516]EOD10950.1 hypothetical protein EMIHUDRAFT_452580 [Emiliania huxleyi CCMP1516]|eukprot:XP_005763379.1 hypothetical protein EMIHUDRAFT_452580 [Emiliania huxleyi CCMP1516]